MNPRKFTAKVQLGTIRHIGLSKAVEELRKNQGLQVDVRNLKVPNKPMAQQA